MLLEVRDITCSYGDVVALHGVSLSLDEGEIVALIGANGAGKSTLLRTISGVMKPRAGEIDFAGRRIDGLASFKVVRLGLAHVPEGRMVLGPLTVRDNLLLGAYVRKDRKEIEADIALMFASFPVLKERSNQLAATLSGGEQQMLAVARALMVRPRAVLMDEPSMGLSPIMVEFIADIVRGMRERGLSVLLVEQNATMALSLADRAYVLELGRVVLEGDAAAVAVDDTVRRAYLGG